MEKVLEVKELRTNFYTDEGVVKAVNGLSYHINKGECVGLVGESGCGKSVSAMSVLRLIPYPPGIIEGGEINFKGRNILELSEAEIQEIRGNKISMIFQEPSTSLNPVLSIERQLTESLELHRAMKRSEAKAESIRLLELVGIPDPELRIFDYPHQFSGGMQQRIMIAMALSCSPDLIIADEPTTALDVTVQAQILELLAEMREKLGTAVLIITHNLGVVARYVDRLHVMYAGSIVETGATDEIYANPKHPYTIGLLKSVPRLDKPRTKEMEVIEGMPPNLSDLPEGCPFSERCSYVMERRGSQVSLYFEEGYSVIQALIARKIVADFRAPGLMRFGFAPLYLRYTDVWDAAVALQEVLTSGEWRDERFQQQSAVT